MAADRSAQVKARNTIFVLTSLALILAGAGLIALSSKRVEWGTEFGAALFTTGVLGTVWQYTVDFWQRQGIVDAMHKVLGEPGRSAGLTDIFLDQDSGSLKQALGTAKRLDAICLFDGRWMDPWRAELVALLDAGGRARFILPDHEDPALMVLLGRRHEWADPERFMTRVRELHLSLLELGRTRPNLELRVLDGPGPAHTAYLLQGRGRDSNGLGVIRPYEHRMRESTDLAEIFFTQDSGLYLKYQNAFDVAWAASLPPSEPRRRRDGIFVLVSGPGDATDQHVELARTVGKLLAAPAGVTMLTGGLGGVMDAAMQGALSKRKSMVRIGFPPDVGTSTVSSAASHLAMSGWGEGRDALLVECADAVVVIGHSHGTMAEVALAAKKGIPVVSLGLRSPWSDPDGRPLSQGFDDPEEAVREAVEAGRAFAETEISRGVPVRAPIRRAQQRV